MTTAAETFWLALFFGAIGGTALGFLMGRVLYRGAKP